ncbi:CTD nuclear envelope phosphatase 1 [Smittium culicis]|uniref:CTD nuclear envelope phosphatase 1 n=1 Tax=Smittium culicis TaxID=133412 RepID=A0A1R1YLK2_9FUNG|nr:CTD nuclear envelope phosphatase 1 [Smittium culicis]OMJ27969.1 CTD nuclear envelope phosphatase 1 [Smittium culicis]
MNKQSLITELSPEKGPKIYSSNHSFIVSSLQYLGVLIYASFYNIIFCTPLITRITEILPNPTLIINKSSNNYPEKTFSSYSESSLYPNLDTTSKESGMLLSIKPEHDQNQEEISSLKKVSNTVNSPFAYTDNSDDSSEKKDRINNPTLQSVCNPKSNITISPLTGNSSSNSPARTPSLLKRSFDFGKSLAKSGSVNTPVKALRKKYLVLDLDETLIHSSPSSSYKSHLRIEVFSQKTSCLYYVYKRPYVDYFLKKVSEWYNVVVFTASLPEYANPIINFLDPKNTLINSRLFRDSCIPHSFSYTKDLKIISEDLSQVVLVDNSPISYYINQENAIPIQSWANNDPNDECLLDLLPFLDALRFTDDVRSILSLRVI